MEPPLRHGDVEAIDTATHSVPPLPLEDVPSEKAGEEEGLHRRGCLSLRQMGKERRRDPITNRAFLPEVRLDSHAQLGEQQTDDAHVCRRVVQLPPELGERDPAYGGEQAEGVRSVRIRRLYETHPAASSLSPSSQRACM